MSHRQLSFVLAVVVMGLPGMAKGIDSAPAYQIVLRTRHAQASPEKCHKHAQTGGGAILVEQPEPNTILVTMSGAAVVGSGFHPSQAGICFDLYQDLEIVANRPGIRPPRIGMIGRVVGTLQVSEPGHFGKVVGNAGQGPAHACLLYAETPMLSVDVEPSAVWCGNKLAINHQSGPVECPAVAGCYRLTASFRLGAQQGKGVLNNHYAVADFDPAPQLDGRWADALQPFRAVPRQDFGFQLVVRVVEDVPPVVQAQN